MHTRKEHLRAKPGVSADDLAKVQRDAWEGVDRYYNAPGHQLPNGNRLHVNVEFTDWISSKIFFRNGTHHPHPVPAPPHCDN